jgi:hypothetical protein
MEQTSVKRSAATDLKMHKRLRPSPKLSLKILELVCIASIDDAPGNIGFPALGLCVIDHGVEKAAFMSMLGNVGDGALGRAAPAR